MCTSGFIRFRYCSGVSFWTWKNTTALSLILTRLKPSAPSPAPLPPPPEHGPMHHYRGRGMSRGPKKLEALGSCHGLIRHCGRNRGNYLFNDALNTFYLRLYDVRHMVKDHSDSERGNPLTPLHGLLFQTIFYMHHSTYHGLCYVSCGVLAGT